MPAVPVVPVVVTSRPAAPLKSSTPDKLIAPLEGAATKDFALILFNPALIPEGAPVIEISPRRLIWPIVPLKVTTFANVSAKVRFLPVALSIVLLNTIAPAPAVAIKLFTRLIAPPAPPNVIPLPNDCMLMSVPVPTMMVAPLFVVTVRSSPANTLPAKVSVPPCSRAIFPLVRFAAFNAPTFITPWAVFKLIPCEVVFTPATLIPFVPDVSNNKLFV